MGLWEVGLEPGLMVAHDTLEATHAAGKQALQEGPPAVIDVFGLNAAPVDGSRAVQRDADGGDVCTRHNGTAVSDLLAGSTEDEVGDLTDRTAPSDRQRLAVFGDRPRHRPLARAA